MKSFVKCRLNCIGPEGGATAVLTLNGLGGSYYEGLKLADFLRENHIATVVERGMQCYSACAFGFLGGSGWSSQEGIGTYVDRMVEPGSVLGFHAPYADEDSFLSAIDQRGAMGAQGQTRDSLALMVKELVKWNVDPEVLFKMVGMGPDETYDLRTADDLYLARVALPPTPTAALDHRPAERSAKRLRQAPCDRRARQPDRDDRSLPVRLDAADRQDGPAGAHLGLHARRPAARHRQLRHHRQVRRHRWRVRDRALLYPRHRRHQCAGNQLLQPAERLVERGHRRQSAEAHPAEGRRSTTTSCRSASTSIRPDLPGEAAIDRNRYNLRLPPLLPTMTRQLGVDATTSTSRVSHVGNVWVFERVGTAELYTTATADRGLGRTLTSTIDNGASFFRQGTYDDTGASFMTLGFIEGDASSVIDIIAINAPGAAATPDQLRTMSVHRLRGKVPDRHADLQLSPVPADGNRQT